MSRWTCSRSPRWRLTPDVSALEQIERDVVACRACPRLVAWREQTATEKVARFADQEYWAKPVPGFGDPAARVLLLGLAPAAHGGNRTGRIFTGDRSGDFLYASLYRTGLANQPTSVSRDDGLALTGAFVTAVNRCAPPGNKPTPVERDTCLPFLAQEMEALRELRVVVALGAFAWDGALRALAASAASAAVRPKPRFGHGAQAQVGTITLLGCFHPSQQNTFTGKLTEPMLDAVLSQAASLADLTMSARRPRAAPSPGVRQPSRGAGASPGSDRTLG
ncbi:MAG: uracil-DNA glycosylase [Actinomycetota bacterium]|nr:uracil-DNA glycosylase [Actinomycetota bacterium]